MRPLSPPPLRDVARQMLQATPYMVDTVDGMKFTKRTLHQPGVTLLEAIMSPNCIFTANHSLRARSAHADENAVFMARQIQRRGCSLLIAWNVD
jgi:hypothetical protein